MIFLTLCFDCRQVSSNDYSSLDTLTKNIVKEKQPFVRLELSKEDLLEMFKVPVLLSVFFLVINYTCNIVRLSWKAEWIIVLLHMELCYVSPLPPFAPFTHMNQMCQWDLGISFERYWVAILKHNLSFLVRQKRNLFFINLRY